MTKSLTKVLSSTQVQSDASSSLGWYGHDHDDDQEDHVDDFGQSVHNIPTNYIDTDVEVSGNSFKETATEGNEQTNNVN